MRHRQAYLSSGLAGVILMAAATVTVAQTGPRVRTAAPSTRASAALAETREMPAPLRAYRDPQIAAALQQISAAKIKATIEKLVSFGTRLTISDGAPGSGRGVVAAREWIKAQFESYSQACGGCLEVKEDRFLEQPTRRIPKPTEIVNVYAVLRGADPEAAKRIVLVTGHYDSRASNDQDVESDAPGANDDGSGTAVSLECARVLSKLKFPGTIVFLTVAGEEQGLNGSHHFAAMAKEQGWQIQAALNNDIVGGDKSPGQDPTVVRVFSEGIPIVDVATRRAVDLVRALGAESDSPSRELARYIRQTGATYSPRSFQPMLVFRPDRYLRGGDHTSFNQQGFAAVRFSEYRENYDHQHQNVRTENGIEYGDLSKFVNYEYVANVARLNAAILASLASAPAPPSHVRLETRKLENDSTLMWDAVPGAREYEVLWRPTTSPDWAGAERVGNVTEATLKRSKDNVIFAVRTLDAQGRRSLAVLPAPERGPAAAPVRPARQPER